MNGMNNDEAACNFVHMIRVAEDRLVGLNCDLANLVQPQSSGRQFLQRIDVQLMVKKGHAHAGRLRGMFHQIGFIGRHGGCRHPDEFCLKAPALRRLAFHIAQHVTAPEIDMVSERYSY